MKAAFGVRFAFAFFTVAFLAVALLAVAFFVVFLVAFVAIIASNDCSGCWYQYTVFNHNLHRDRLAKAIEKNKIIIFIFGSSCGARGVLRGEIGRFHRQNGDFTSDYRGFTSQNGAFSLEKWGFSVEDGGFSLEDGGFSLWVHAVPAPSGRRSRLENTLLPFEKSGFYEAIRPVSRGAETNSLGRRRESETFGALAVRSRRWHSEPNQLERMGCATEAYERCVQ